MFGIANGVARSYLLTSPWLLGCLGRGADHIVTSAFWARFEGLIWGGREWGRDGDGWRGGEGLKWLRGASGGRGGGRGI